MTRPIQSMTGSAVHSHSAARFNLQIELKSVNSRFLDLSFKLADETRLLEPALRERLGAAFLRGKIECRLMVKHQAQAMAETSAGGDERLDARSLDALLALQAQVLARSPQTTPLSVADILRWPGVVPESEVPPGFEGAALQALDAAIIKLTQSRQTEGRSLASFVSERLDAIAELAAGLQARTPELLAAHEKRLTERLEASLGKAESLNQAIDVQETLARIRQEITLYGIKIDIAEEISRLESHLLECRAILKRPGPCGKRLDFMVQELNREANTLGSKSVAIGLSQTSVELKVLIEQIREQIQNLE